MDIQKIISDLLAKIQGDSRLLEKVQSDPAETVKGLLGGLNLDANQLTEVVTGLVQKLGLGNIAEAVSGAADGEKAGGLLSKLKGLLGL